MKNGQNIRMNYNLNKESFNEKYKFNFDSWQCSICYKIRSIIRDDSDIYCKCQNNVENNIFGEIIDNKWSRIKT